MDQHPAQASSAKLPPAVEGNKYRNLQADIMQIVRDLGTIITKCYISWTQRVRQPTQSLQGLHQVFYVYIYTMDSSLMLLQNSWISKGMSLWILWLFLYIFFHFICLVQIQCDNFYLIMFYFVTCHYYPLEACLSYNER